jgi:hypothetical protein
MTFKEYLTDEKIKKSKFFNFVSETEPKKVLESRKVEKRVPVFHEVFLYTIAHFFNNPIL